MKSPTHGSTNGTDYEDNADAPCEVNVVGFNIRHGEYINGLQMKYIDKSGKIILGAWGGRDDGGNLTQANFTYGEIIRGISGMTCTSTVHYFGRYIRQLFFTAETENKITRVYGPYGEPTGQSEQASCSVFSIVGNIKSVFGKKVVSSSNGLENLGAIGAHLLSQEDKNQV